MGIELPAELSGVADQAGVQWPEADEEAMAKQAKAWREAATSMESVTTDADRTVRGALTSVHGDTGTAATKHWQTFVEPDSGHLTSTVRGMNAAADRLEHAANQVGTAKVEIVRNLVSLAQNSDAAHSAAAAGHPMALAGLDTAVRGTSANVANIQSNLVNAVQPASGVDMSGTHDPVNANPGAHGPVDTLLSDTTALADDTTQGATNLVDHTTHGATDLVGNSTQGATNLVDHTAHGATDLVGNTTQGATNLVDHATHGATNLVDTTAHGGTALVGNTTHDATNLVDNTAHGGPNLVDHTARGATDLVGNTAHGGSHVIGDAAQGGTHLVGDTGHRATDLAGNAAPGATHVVDTAAGHHGGPGLGNAPGGVPQAVGHLADPDITGPVPADSFPDEHPTPPTGLPTPPTGTTVEAGFAGGVDVPAANPAANLPPVAPGLGSAPAPGVGAGIGTAGGGPGFGGAPVFGGGPSAPAPGGMVGGPVGARPAPGPVAPIAGGAGPTSARPGETGGRVGGVAEGGARPTPGVRPGAPGTGAPAPRGTAPPGSAAPGTSAPGPRTPGVLGGPRGPVAPGASRPVDALLPEPRKYGGAMPPAPMPGMPAAPAKERDEALAVFWVHMFPIGHMPVAAAKPARQLPAPPPELDYAAGLRFEPGDHPRADLVDSTERRAALREGVEPLEPSDSLAEDAPPVAALAAGHDPLGGDNERDWDRRYLVRFGSVTAHGISREGVEFAWPPAERYPEGGSAEGEAEVLDEGTELDRFGRWEGRVFAAAGTPFAQRSLPPTHLEQGYRRYRVLRPLPVWRAVSAAWFAQPGGGVRYRTTHSAMELLALGYLADVTHEEPIEEHAEPTGERADDTKETAE
jgi:nicrotizing toxin Mtb-like protein